MKKIRLNIEDLFELSGSEIFNPDDFIDTAFVSIDSRNIKKNSIFIAIKGEKFDGHSFINEAVQNGASTVIINRSNYKKYKNLNQTIVTVEDTVKTLGELAARWRNKLNAKVISITGSNGKTSTKDMLFDILSTKFKVNKTTANNNNHIGVPLTLLATDNSYDYLILEQGTNHFGEIEYTANIARPDYSLITNIGDSHLEFLVDRNGVLEEKEKLFAATELNNGTVFINCDDKLLKGIRKKYSRTVTFGIKSACDFTGDILGYSDDGRSNLSIKIKNLSIETVLPLYGSANAKNFLACTAVAYSLGMSPEEIKKAAEKLVPASKRLSVKIKNDHIIIDDTYNANPASFENAIELLRKIKKHKNKILVIGDMFELGKSAFEKHMGLYKVIQKARISRVICIGEMMKYLSMKLNEIGITSQHFQNRNELAGFIQKLELKNTVVLFKGSRGMKMEEFFDLTDRRGE